MNPIKDTNDNYPIFDKTFYNATIFENITVGEIVTAIFAHDRDKSQQNSQVAYRITDIQDKFVIDSQTGVITVAPGASLGSDILNQSINPISFNSSNFLDRDLTHKDEYNLDIVALDQGFPQRSASTKLQITIVDINNKPPAFREKVYHIGVLESVPINSSLINLTALDLDKSARLIYTIVGYTDAETDEGQVVDSLA